VLCDQEDWLLPTTARTRQWVTPVGSDLVGTTLVLVVLTTRSGEEKLPEVSTCTW
jgi:hypothetical protein